MNKIRNLLTQIKDFFRGLIFDKNGIPSLTDTTYLIHMAVGWGLMIYIVRVYFPNLDWRLLAVFVVYQVAMMFLKFAKTFSISYRDIKAAFSKENEEEKE